MTPIESLMRQWLASGDPDLAARARRRIAHGFGPRPARPDGGSLAPVTVVVEDEPEVRISLARRLVLVTCPYRGPDPSCGCANQKCWMPRTPVFIDLKTCESCHPR